MKIDLSALKADALKIRKKFIKMHYEVKAGHLGTGLSSIDVLTYLYRHWLRSPGKEGGDRFILSKGHGASALYATLHHVGLLTDQELSTYYRDGTSLPAHPAARALKTIPAATGSLGHGLPIAVGLAYTHQILHADESRITCLMSDGECNEGSVWEAALFASHHKLTNLTVIVDANGLQGFGRTEEVLKMDHIAKFKAFGFDTLAIDGHDFEAINAAVLRKRTAPLCIVAKTVKGKGISYMENKLEWHYLPMNEQQYTAALAELSGNEASDAR